MPRPDSARSNIVSCKTAASVLSVWNTAPAKSIKDATKTQAILGATSNNSSWYHMVKLMNPLAGTKFKIVTGYKGSRGVDLAMERHEIHGRAMVWASTKARRGDWLMAGKLVHLAQIGPYKLSDLPNVPRLIDMAKSENRKPWCVSCISPV